jgi:hypothetical protein
MGPRLRKFALTSHITFSIGWIGAVLAFLALVLTAMTRDDPATLRGAWIAIVPLAVASLLTGLVMSLGTKWGLFRHYWTMISLVLTIAATAVLLGNMQSVSHFAAMATDDAADPGALRGALDGELLHAGAGLVVLLVVQVLNVYKPQGMTRYGRREQGAQ